MLTLVVRQSLSDGTSKTWKLKPDQQTHTFGASRLADIISLSEGAKGIQAVFEFRDNAWWFLSLDMTETENNSTLIKLLDQESSLKLNDCELQIVPLKNEVDLYQNMSSTADSEATGTQKYQLYVARQSGKVVETKLLPLKKRFYPQVLNSPIEVEFIESATWHKMTVGPLEVSQKTISLVDSNQFSQLKFNELIEEDSKKGLYFTIGFAFLLITMGILAPKGQGTDQYIAPKTFSAQKIIFKTDTTKPRKKPDPVATPLPSLQQIAVEAAPKGAAQMPVQSSSAKSGGTSKASKLLNAISGARISQLIGKVSAQAARSQNVVIVNGIKAGTGASGRALAALGSIEKSGHDWNAEGSTSAVVISTAGHGGGKNASSMGRMIAGTTGNAGVGLIEEESEITGGLDREVIAQYIKSQLGQILYCYERQLSANPNLFGKVAVKFTIGSTGAIDQQSIADTTLKSASVEGCILSKVSKWQFPKPQGGTKVVVTYPFLFKSTN